MHIATYIFPRWQSLFLIETADSISGLGSVVLWLLRGGIINNIFQVIYDKPFNVMLSSLFFWGKGVKKIGEGMTNKMGGEFFYLIPSVAQLSSAIHCLFLFPAAAVVLYWYWYRYRYHHRYWYRYQHRYWYQYQYRYWYQYWQGCTKYFLSGIKSFSRRICLTKHAIIHIENCNKKPI